MKVILIYDIELKSKEDQNRLNRVRKIGRRYLHHVQKSVFEGELTEGQIYRMESEILRVIDKDRDSVIIYVFPEGVRWQRKILSNLSDKVSNML